MEKVAFSFLGEFKGGRGGRGGGGLAPRTCLSRHERARKRRAVDNAMRMGLDRRRASRQSRCRGGTEGLRWGNGGKAAKGRQPPLEQGNGRSGAASVAPFASTASIVACRACPSHSARPAESSAFSPRRVGPTPKPRAVRRSGHQARADFEALFYKAERAFDFDASCLSDNTLAPAIKPPAPSADRAESTSSRLIPLLAEDLLSHWHPSQSHRAPVVSVDGFLSLPV